MDVIKIINKSYTFEYKIIIFCLYIDLNQKLNFSFLVKYGLDSDSTKKLM